jgi:hypothetical protein
MDSNSSVNDCIKLIVLLYIHMYEYTVFFYFALIGGIDFFFPPINLMGMRPCSDAMRWWTRGIDALIPRCGLTYRCGVSDGGGIDAASRIDAEYRTSTVVV